jgi:hypothetical protein
LKPRATDDEQDMSMTTSTAWIAPRHLARQLASVAAGASR